MGSQPRMISASRGAAILGMSEFVSQFQVWQEIMEERQPGFNAARGFVLPEKVDNASTRWGLAFEDAVVSLAEESTGKTIAMREEFFTRDGFMTCHIDGMYTPFKPLAPEVLHEGKTTFEMAYNRKWGEPGTDRIPQTYQVQVQHQMGCTNAGEVIVSVLVFPKAPEEWEKLGWIPRIGHSGATPSWYLVKSEEPSSNGVWCGDWARILSQMGFFHQYPVKADSALQKTIFDAYAHFWDHYILTGKEPQLSDYEDLKRAFPEPVGTIVCDDETGRWFDELKSITDEIGGKGPLSKRADSLRLMILDKARTSDKTLDDDSREKTLFMSQDGKKLGSYYKTKTGSLVFRAN
jgi:hypothetical protein